jgi:hypothetical protein
MQTAIKKATERLRYHERVLKGRVAAPKLTLTQKQQNVNKAESFLASLIEDGQGPDKIVTREDWLIAFVKGSRPIFENAGCTIPPKIKISIGFPSQNALSGRKQRLGEHWGTETTDHHIFITPLIDDAIKIAEITTHELVHACVGNHHRKAFSTCGAAVGLEGKAAQMEAGELWHKLHESLLKALGPIPHHKIIPALKDEKKQTTRLLKCTCPDCGFVFRTTAKWLEGKSQIQCPDIDCGAIIKLNASDEEE